MRRTHVLLTLVLLTLSTVWAAGPAVAGGPTSVLLSVPGEGRMAALYHTEADYQRLGDLAGVFDDVGKASAPRHLEGSGEVVTLTWLIHDVHVWRVDYVHLGGAGAPWVETREVVDDDPWWEAPTVWHRGDARLRGLLTRVLHDPGSAPGASTPAPATLTEQAATPAATPAAVQQRSPLVLAAWTGGGVAAGALLTLLTLVVLRRRSRREPAPVGERPAMGDQLVWP
ncbi:MAG TPA: hypothetical protein VFG72_07240 [Marmoricola sp.]|nr:hypothetical protein [Marmoricola sp.]